MVYPVHQDPLAHQDPQENLVVLHRAKEVDTKDPVYQDTNTHKQYKVHQDHVDPQDHLEQEAHKV